MKRPLLTPAQAAEHLAMPVETLRRWRDVRTGPAFIRVGRHVRYRPEDIEAWLNERTVTGEVA